MALQGRKPLPNHMREQCVKLKHIKREQSKLRNTECDMKLHPNDEGKFESELLDMFTEFLPNMMDARDVTSEKYIKDYVKANAFPAIAEKCKSELLRKFKCNMGIIKDCGGDVADFCSTLLWIVDLVESCDGKLLETMLKMFAEDVDLCHAITVNHKTYSEQSIDILLDILINRFLKAMGRGEITATPSFGVLFLEIWLDTIVRLIIGHPRQIWSKMKTDLEEAIVDLADTLPLAEQRRIFHIWEDTFDKHCFPEGSSAREWWGKKLHDAIITQK